MKMSEKLFYAAIAILGIDMLGTIAHRISTQLSADWGRAAAVLLIVSVLVYAFESIP